MPVTKFPSTLDGGLSPICRICHGKADFDISEEEYRQMKMYWDNWVCPYCKKEGRR